jgi:N-acetylglucosamine kinase-like BadF-type ATPase
VEQEPPLVIGVDAGGSHTGVLVASAAGARIAAAASGGGNPTSNGLGATVSSLRAGLESALFGLDRGAIRYAVLGVAGAGPCIDELQAAVRDRWRALGLECPFQIVSDLEAAFAAGTSAEDGIVLVAGTGAAAAKVRQARVVRIVDGHGWLLGDDGSGFWLGRESLRACLAHIDGRGRPTGLTEPVLRALGVADAPDDPAAARRVKEAVYRRPPVALAELAPLVTTAAADGDEVAAAIVDRAAALLIATAEALLGPRPETLDGVVLDPGPEALGGVVLAGSVLLAPGPLSSAVRSGLRGRFGRFPALATDGAAGAAVLALRALTGRPITPAVHERVRGAAGFAADQLAMATWTLQVAQ